MPQGGWNRKDLSGQRFGMLIVLEKLPSRLRKVMWRCQCDCGAEADVRGSHLISGWNKSCGCNRIKAITTHGLSRMRSTEYVIWQGMKQRCLNPKNAKYGSYGARGITVCERWLAFENFLADMGSRPAGLTLERVNNDKGYGPDNCKWATLSEQARNRRTPSRLSGRSKGGLQREARLAL